MSYIYSIEGISRNERERERKTDRQTERERQTDRETVRDRETEKKKFCLVV